VFGVGLFVAAAIAVAPQQEPPIAAAEVRITDDQFAAHIDAWSETEGYFDSDNFITNETSFLHVVDELRRQVQPGGVYIGVGPDQNFSYIAHTRPSLAVIIDVRRQNMLQHLLFKALFDRASSRTEYLALLFGKKTPKVSPDAPADELIRAIREAPADAGALQANLEWVKETLVRDYRLHLSEDDLRKIEYTYSTFAAENLDLRFSTIGRMPSFRYPRYEEVLLETDRNGDYRSFISSEELFLWLKQFQAQNRLIPIVGDFGGEAAFKSVATFLKLNGWQVTTFYTSNVEFYLFGRPDWRRYIENVHALPVSDSAVFIRSYFPSFGHVHPLNVAGHRPTSLVHRIVPFLEDSRSGRLESYWDVVKGGQ
jgi:hypothetical protein